MNAITTGSAGPIAFNFEGSAVRIIDRSGAPWTVLPDACKVLDIGNASDAARRLDDDERDGVDIIDPMGRSQRTTIISESGLYSLILTSRKAQARRFKKWITGEVLPAIRRTGGYMVAGPNETPEELALRALTVMHETLERKKAQLAAAEIRADAAEEAARESDAALDNIAGTDGSYCIRDAGKVVGMTQAVFVRFLIARQWIYRSETGRLSAFALRVSSGDLEMKTAIYPGRDGCPRSAHQVRVTARGLVTIAKILERIG